MYASLRDLSTGMAGTAQRRRRRAAAGAPAGLARPVAAHEKAPGSHGTGGLILISSTAAAQN